MTCIFKLMRPIKNAVSLISVITAVSLTSIALQAQSLRDYFGNSGVAFGRPECNGSTCVSTVTILDNKTNPKYNNGDVLYVQTNRTGQPVTQNGNIEIMNQDGAGRLLSSSRDSAGTSDASGADRNGNDGVPPVPGEKSLDDAEDALAKCDGLAKGTYNACNKFEDMALIQAMVQQFNSARATGNSKDMCKTGKMLNGAVAAANTFFAMKCRRQANTCMETCTGEAENYKRAARSIANVDQGQAFQYRDIARQMEAKVAACEQNKGSSAMMLVQAGVSAVTAFESSACENKQQDDQIKCETLADLESKPQCKFQLCPSSTFRTHPLCKDFFGEYNCDLPETQYTRFCLCKKYPNDPSCGTPTPPDPTNPNDPNNPNNPLNPGNGNNNNNIGDNPFDGAFDGADLGGGLDSDGDGIPDNMDPDPNNPNNTEFKGNNGQGAVSGNAAGGGLSGTGGFSGNGGGGGGRRGGGKGPYNTDIMGGVQGGGGSAGGGAGGFSGANPFGARGAGKDDKDGKFNLKDFLPGGKGAREVAGKAELEKNGITEANGLSNFEKIRRQMNTMRQRNEWEPKP